MARLWYVLIIMIIAGAALFRAGELMTGSIDYANIEYLQAVWGLTVTISGGILLAVAAYGALSLLFGRGQEGPEG
jgi:hypothetical protein